MMHSSFACPLMAVLVVAACSSAANPTRDGASTDGARPADNGATGAADGGGAGAAGRDGMAFADLAVGDGPSADRPSPTDGPAADAASAAPDRVVPDAPPDVPTTATLCTPPRSWVALPYRVGSAGYSRTLDQLVLLPVNDRALHLFDPDTCRDRRVPLARMGLSISVHPDGRRAVVGHDGYVTRVDLVTGTASAPVPVFLPASEVVLDARGRTHLFTRAERGTYVPLWSLDESGGLTAPTSKLEAAGHLRRTPDGASLFWLADDGTTSQRFNRVDPDTGAPGKQGNPFPDFQVCHDLFATDDSRRLITACGVVVRLSADPMQDLVKEAALAGSKSIRHLDSAIGSGRVVSIYRAGNLIQELNDDTVLHVHDAQTWQEVRTIPLPAFEVTSTGPDMRPQTQTTPAHGMFVFVRGDASRYHVVAGGSSLIGDLGGHAVATLPADGSAVPPPPLPRRQPDPAASDGRPFLETVTAAVSPLPYNVVAAGFSRSLGRLVLASASPGNALHLADPDSGLGESIPLPGTPRLLAVRDDGVVAAVVHDGGLAFIDLTTRAVLWTSAAHPPFVAFGAPPRVLFDGGGGLAWFDLDRGTSERTPWSGAAPFVVAPGTDSVYQAGEKLTRYDWGAMAGLPRASHDLALFRSGSFDSCGRRLWLTGSARHLVLDCARVFQLSADPGSDLRYRGSLDWLASATATIYTARLERFVSLVGSYRTARGYEVGTGELALHEPLRLGLARRVSWRGSTSEPALRGQHLFEGPTGRLHVVGVKDDGTQRAVLVGVDL